MPNQQAANPEPSRTKKRRSEETEKREPETLFLPHNLETLDNQDDGTVSGTLLFGHDDSMNGSHKTLLCGPLPLNESNLLAWFMRGTSTEYELPIPSDLAKFQELSQNTELAKKMKKLNKAYHRRREEMRVLASKLGHGGATIDVDDRLVALPGEDDGAMEDEDNGQEVDGRNENAGNGENLMQDDPMFDDDPGLLGAFLGFGEQDFIQEEEMRRRAFDRQEAEAERAIAEAVEKYKKDGVPEEDYEVLWVPPLEDDCHSLTLRRICFAVIFVLGAFGILMVQSIPIIHEEKKNNPKFDRVLHEILNVRDFQKHVNICGSLQRDDATNGTSNENCADGVLHIPSVDKLGLAYSGTPDFPYSKGVNVSWYHPCVLFETPESTCILRREVDPSNGTCQEQPQEPSCFRGIHDGIITNDEVDNLIQLGASLVQNGGDHLHIYDDTTALFTASPSVISKLESLLRTKYFLPRLSPVAFRINAVLPFDRTAIHKHSISKKSPLLQLVNISVYQDWGKQILHMNSWSHLLLSPLLRSPLFKDPCILLSELAVNKSYAFQTSVFLSSGAGEDFSGGNFLFVDDHASNAYLKNKINRGAVIDGSKGRIVVHSGGDDNLRCRLPVRTGVRAILQVWWDC